MTEVNYHLADVSEASAQAQSGPPDAAQRPLQNNVQKSISWMLRAAALFCKQADVCCASETRD